MGSKLALEIPFRLPTLDTLYWERPISIRDEAHNKNMIVEGTEFIEQAKHEYVEEESICKTSPQPLPLLAKACVMRLTVYNGSRILT